MQDNLTTIRIYIPGLGTQNTMTQGTIQVLAHTLAPWQSLYSNSKLVSGSVTFGHLAGLLFGGGFAVASDRATWRALHGSPTQRAYLLSELNAVHRPVLAGLALLFVSGLLLAAADIETFMKSPVFWVKLTLVALLCLNGFILQRTEIALRRHGDSQIIAEPSHPLWRRLRTTTVASMGLWTATALVGTILMSS